MSTPGDGTHISYFSRHAEVKSQKVPISAYQENYFKKELEHVFPKVWLNSGCRGQDIADAGAYFVLDLPLFKTSILFCRGEDGAVRAFHNVCSHRGSPVVYDHCGHSTRFICPFHNWTYDTQGRLVGAPGAREGIPGFNRSQYGLTPVAVDLWNDFIFFSLTPPKTSLKEYLGEWGESLSGYPFSKLAVSNHYKIKVKANWKVILDAFQEVFHVPFLHGRSQADVLQPNNPLSRSLGITTFGDHGQIVFPANQTARILNRESSAGGQRAASSVTEKLGEFGRQCKRDDFSPKHFPRGVNSGRHSNWAFDINVIYPNWWIAVRGDHFHTYNFWPLAHDVTLYEVRFYYPPPMHVKERLCQEMRRVRVRNSLPEDLSTVERTQSMINSGARDHFILTDEELLIAHHHFVGNKYIHAGEG